MQIQIWQIVLLALYGAWSIYDGLNTAIGFKGSAVTGMFVGLIMGDLETGLIIGGTLQLMSLGIGSYGGASVPDYNTATIISTAFAVSAGMSTSAAIGLAIPISLIAVNFDIFARFINTFLQHRAESYAKQEKYHKVARMNILGNLSWSLSRFLPIFISLWLGNSFVKAALNAMPDWIMGGLRVAGGILPALGIAILLKYLPVKKYFAFVLIGFALTAYGKMPMIGVSIVALAIALLISMVLQKDSSTVVSAASNSVADHQEIGVDEDE